VSAFILFAILGVVTGGLYALLSLGLVVIFRGSGVLNLAQGAFAYFGATMFYTLNTDFKWPTAVAVVVAIVLGGVLGVITNQLVMRPLRKASNLTRLVATLGLMIALENIIDWRLGENSYTVIGFLPTTPVHFFKNVTVGADRLILLGISVVLALVLHQVYTRTRFGLVTSAVAANEQAAASLGWSPNRIASINWAIGGVLAATAGVLLAPLIGVTPNTMSLLIVPAVASALIGRFESFSLLFLVACVIGIAQDELSYYVPSVPGLSYALPFALLILVPFLSGDAIPRRGTPLVRFPRVGTGGFNWKASIPLAVAAAAVAYLLSPTWQTAFSISCIGVVLGLSVVVITGFAGQLSVAQFSLAGIAAWVTGQAAAHIGLPFWAALIVGPLVGVVIGMLIAIPSLRIRDVGLAVATLGLAAVVENMLFDNTALTGGLAGALYVGHISFLGWNIYPVSYPWRYAIVCLAAAVLCGFVVATLRRSATGRRLLAVRSNERAAASLGIEVNGAKFYAFALAAGIAGLGGVLYAFLEPDIVYTSFTSLASIQLVLYAVLAGVGFATGGVLMGLIFTGGLIGQLAINLFHSGELYQAIASLLLIATLIFNQDGLIKVHLQQYEWIRKRFAALPSLHRLVLNVGATGSAADGGAISSVPAAGQAPVAHVQVSPARSGTEPVLRGKASPTRQGPPLLVVSDLSVRFGGVEAVRGLSFSVHAGEVVGLIGANGAGKTTVIDAISGFVPRYDGQIAVSGERIDNLRPSARARMGIRRTFQSLELFEDMSVLDNIAAAYEDHSFADYFRDLVAPANSPLTDTAQRAIEQFHLTPELPKLPSELSYGTRRSAAIARAVAMPSKLLLLDEPTAGLDSADSGELGLLVRAFAAARGVGVLLVEHDVDLVTSVCDRLIALDFGKKVAEGAPGEVVSSAVVQEAYLGTEGVSPASSLGPLTESSM
jgi:ABC-type branched-subunit amino acid transport system ATPase component/branched-subunit amino acid ABC-type transport system permease component